MLVYIFSAAVAPLRACIITPLAAAKMGCLWFLLFCNSGLLVLPGLLRYGCEVKKWVVAGPFGDQSIAAWLLLPCVSCCGCS